MTSSKVGGSENKSETDILDMQSIKDNHLNEQIDVERDSSIEKKEFPKDYPYAEDDFEKLPEKSNIFASYVARIASGLNDTASKFTPWTIALLLLIPFIVLYIWSMICKTRHGTLFTVEDNIRLLWLGCVIFAFAIYKIIKSILIWRNVRVESFKNKPVWWDTFCRVSFLVACAIVASVIALYIIFTIAIKQPYNLVSISGIVVLMLFCYAFSTAPNMVNWRPVLLGILLQFIFACLILTTKPGYEVFQFIGNRVTEFLAHTEAGSIMLFGDKYADHFFAFRVLPIIVFLSSITAILHYTGVLQVLIVGLGSLMQAFMGTTAGESLNAAGNIFLGMTESPLLIRHLLGRMTNSELHAVMTGGFATIAGSVLGAYIRFGAPANHLISASVMSAPAALSVSKLICPETKKSKTSKNEMKNLPPCRYGNIVEAATTGASESIPLVANIAVNILAFVAILHFINSLLHWIGERACLEYPFSFELICSYVFWPLSLFMGVAIQDCRKVAELIGIKTFLNEFVAYERLGVLLSNTKIIKNAINATIDYRYDDIILKYQNGTNLTLTGGRIYDDRSLVIATYALCGFANFGSMGIFLSSLSVMIPHRRADLSRLVVRAMIAGNIACFLTASIAGLFYKPGG